MKRTVFLICAGAALIFLSGMKTEVYGQGMCCSDGYQSESFYLLENGTCQLVAACDREHNLWNQCTPSCNAVARQACYASGRYWDDLFCQCLGCHPDREEECTSMGRNTDTSTCQCTDCLYSAVEECFFEGFMFSYNSCQCATDTHYCNPSHTHDVTYSSPTVYFGDEGVCLCQRVCFNGAGSLTTTLVIGSNGSICEQISTIWWVAAYCYDDSCTENCPQICTMW